MPPDQPPQTSDKHPCAIPVERGIRILAGSLIIIGLLLAYTVHPYWIALVAFVGLNLFQSGFTNFCPAEIIIRRILSKRSRK